MSNRFFVAFIKIFNGKHIPPLPRGMLASEYTHIPDDARRVIARYGARDPKGVKLAMKKYGVETVDELVSLLEHHQAKREFMHRLKLGFGRLVGGLDHDPHADEIRQLKRNTRKARDTKAIQERVKQVQKRFKEKNP